MKTAAAFVLLWVTPLAWSQDTTVSQQAPAMAAPASAQTAAPTKTQEQASKTGVKVNAEKEAAIRKLFEIQGTRKSMEQVFTGMSENMKPTLAKMLPPGGYQDKLIPLFFEKFQSKMKTDDLLDLIVPIYDKYLSKDDIDGLAQFYQTPLGKKLNSVLPQLTVEIQTTAMNMGQELGRQAMMEVLGEHPELQKALQDASAQKN